MSDAFAAFEQSQRLIWRPDGVVSSLRQTAQETPIAFVYDGGAEAVMMATPADLEDFAIGFSLAEGIVAHESEITELEILECAQGIEVRMRLAPTRAQSLAKRRRTRVGPVGCGLCGVESLEAALPPLARVESALSISPHQLIAAMQAMTQRQSLNQITRATHAAGFFLPGQGVIAVREDVGRHNALDKLAGAMARDGRNASGGAVLLSSRVSVDLVQKAARLSAPILAAASAPTAMALRVAEAAGIGVAAIVRDDGLEIFTRPDRFGL